jgi:hypothetical protein
MFYSVFSSPCEPKVHCNHFFVPDSSCGNLLSHSVDLCHMSQRRSNSAASSTCACENEGLFTPPQLIQIPPPTTPHHTPKVPERTLRRTTLFEYSYYKYICLICFDTYTICIIMYIHTKCIFTQYKSSFWQCWRDRSRPRLKEICSGLHGYGQQLHMEYYNSFNEGYTSL